MRRIERRTERGTAAVEMALLLAFIVAVTIGAVTFFGRATDAHLTRSGTQVEQAGATTTPGSSGATSATCAGNSGGNGKGNGNNCQSRK